MEFEHLKSEFDRYLPGARNFCAAVAAQIQGLLDKHSVAIGVPMEHRIKSWSSIYEKLDRKSLTLNSILDLDDLIGIRIILLFKPDLEKVDSVLSESFVVEKVEDTGAKLAYSEFGYQSKHYIIRMPDEWLQVPTYAGLGNFKAELQVRTLAQHIWAAASHKLQYKSEASVPPPLRRTIHRISALLEIVDLEFERAILGRNEYIDIGLDKVDAADELNVESLKSTLSEKLPAENLDIDEDFSELLADLFHFDIRTIGDLSELLDKRMSDIMEGEREEMERVSESSDYIGTSKERHEAGVYFTHVGLARKALSKEYDKEWENWITRNL